MILEINDAGKITRTRQGPGESGGKRFVGNYLLALAVHDSKEQVMETLSRLENDHFAGPATCRLRLPGSMERDFLVTGLKSNGTRYVILNDVSHHESTRRMFMDLHTRVRRLFESLPVAVVIARTSGEIVAVNEAAQQLLGLTLKEFLGRHVLSVFESRAERTEESFMALLSKSTDQTTVINVHRQAGECIPVELTVRRVEQEGQSQFLLSMVDIVEREQMQRLRQEFYAMVTHDLRTPLNSIQCFLDGIVNGVYPPDSPILHFKARVAQQELSRLLDLTNRLLDIEKLEQGPWKISAQKFPLDRFIERVVLSLSALFEERGVRISTRVDDVFVVADRELLERATINLISNAINVSPAGESVAVCARQQQNDLIIEVQDSGPGIPVEYRERIFDRFQQIPLTRSKQGAGTGLGLAICKVIAEAHGGSIGVRSDEGEGSIFWMKVPLLTVPSSE